MAVELIRIALTGLDARHGQIMVTPQIAMHDMASSLAVDI